MSGLVSGLPEAMKRFYKTVSVERTEYGFEIHLDGKPMKTRGRNVLRAPTRPLAEAIRTEWDDQINTIDPAQTALTGLLAGAIDADAASQWRSDILDYLRSDLVCYRAEAPLALVDRQKAAWYPYLDWLRDELGAALVVTTGINAIAQPDIAIDRIGTILDGAGRETLAGLRKATAITGSAVMGLALWKKGFAPHDIFAASLVDEIFQAEKWGEDAEALARRGAIEQEFIQTARFLDLLEGA